MTQPINPYLNFDGKAADAMKFYQKTLGGKLDLMLNKDLPPNPEVPPGNENRVMHARLVTDRGTIMASDTLTNHKFGGMHGFALALTYDTAGEAKKVFEKLAEGGKVSMPVGETFWAEAFGMCTDRFGTPWMVNGAMKPMQ